MTEQYIFWALVVGIVMGAAIYWFAFGRLARRTDDLTPGERKAEAAWIGRTIEARGGVAPADLVDEVLELHAAYLAGPALDVDDAFTNSADSALARPGRPQPGEPQGS